MDPVTGSLILGAGSGLLGMLGSSSTNSANKEIAQMNIDFQREANAKNESLMRESWGRDDNAVQRRSIDLQKAGMSPLLAAGAAAGNSGAVSYKAPESKQVVKETGFGGALSGIYQGIMANQSLMSTIAQQQQMDIAQGTLDIQQKDQLLRSQANAREQALFANTIKYDDRNKAALLLKSVLDNAVTDYNLAVSKRKDLRTTDQLDSLVKKIEALSNLAGQTITPVVNKVNEATGRNKTIKELLDYSKNFKWRD